MLLSPGGWDCDNAGADQHGAFHVSLRRGAASAGILPPTAHVHLGHRLLHASGQSHIQGGACSWVAFGALAECVHVSLIPKVSVALASLYLVAYICHSPVCR